VKGKMQINEDVLSLSINKKNHNLKRFKKVIQPLLFLLPSIILLSAVYLIPILNVAKLSFADATMIEGFKQWVGFKNFTYLIKPEFLASLWKTLIWLVSTVGISLIIGLAISLLLNKPIPGRPIFRTIVILPWLFPEALIAVMWLWTIHSHYGFLNNILIKLGIIDTGVNFLSTSLAFITVIVIRIWRDIPFVVMSLMAGLQTIPHEIEEAAEMDGAVGFKKIWYITLPLLKPIILTCTLILSAWTLIIFDMVYILTGGGPNNATKILSILMYDTAFSKFDFGLTSAMAIVTLLMVSIIGAFYLRNLRNQEK
jgi:multiple sugar transport system permease protein